jgi:predicted metal-dependent hydrolase
MGLFEEVQKELFDFIGAKRPEKPEKPKHLDELGLPYTIERQPRKRRVSFTVTHSGTLKVSANQTISEKEILILLMPHLDWIQSQSEERKKLKDRFPQKLWKTGEEFPFKGESLTLILSPSETKKSFIRFMSESFEYFYPLSWLDEDRKSLEQKLHEGLLRFFKQEASHHLNDKVNHWAEVMNLQPKSVSFRNQKSRWGSCSSQGRINLNWKLACFDQDIQDYVIIHELAHLVHQNHSKRFWSLVEKYMPDYKKHSQRLENQAFKVDCFLPVSELYDVNPKWPE